MQKFQFKILCIMFLVVFASGCATVPGEYAAPPKGQIYLKDFCDRYGIAWQWDHISQVVTLKLDEGDVCLLAGSNVILAADRKLTLSAPIGIYKSSVMAPYDLKQRITGRFKEKLEEMIPAVFPGLREVVIDAGHGGKDPGTIGLSGTQEKTVVLDIALKLKAVLERQGIKVTMTRTGDEFISLQERTEIASRSKADLFVSVHANSSPVRGVNGIEVFSLKDLGVMEKNEVQRLENHQLMFKRLSIKTNPASVEDIVSDLLYSHKQSVSGAFASMLAEKTSRTAKMKNRGQKESRFFVLRNTLIPAVLVEAGFLSNPKEERLLKTSDYRQKIAEGLAKSILEYANGL